jgi:hypothetical protein
LRQLQSEIESMIAYRCISSKSIARVPLQVEPVGPSHGVAQWLSWRGNGPALGRVPGRFLKAVLRKPSDLVNPINHRVSSIAPAA